jgi:hypothetical protein
MRNPAGGYKPAAVKKIVALIALFHVSPNNLKKEKSTTNYYNTNKHY